MAIALPHQPLLCHVLLLPTPLLKWPELVLAVAHKPRSIAVALTFLLSFPLALIASSAPHSRAPTNKHSSSHQKAIQTTSEGVMGSPDLGSRRALRTTLIGLHLELLSWKISHKMLSLYKPPAPIASSLQGPCCVKRSCNPGSLEESRRFPSFCG